MAKETDRLKQGTDERRLDTLAAALARLIDNSSSFTTRHSQRVAILSDMMAAELRLGPLRRRRLNRAALLHDIGKLAISGNLLDKPGRLTEEEFAAVKLHAAYTEVILAAIPDFAELAAVAGAHHERLDGCGYPRGLAGGEIGIETRILTVADVFEALTAARPYREALAPADALNVMAREIGTAFDAACFAALQAALARGGRRAA